MSIMSEIDIMRQEGAREPEDFEAHGYNREVSEAMAEIVQQAEIASREELDPKTRKQLETALR